jgi:GH24 family phage-related lysozyme (muramidase)
MPAQPCTHSSLIQKQQAGQVEAPEPPLPRAGGAGVKQLGKERKKKRRRREEKATAFKVGD